MTAGKEVKETEIIKDEVPVQYGRGEVVERPAGAGQSSQCPPVGRIRPV